MVDVAAHIRVPLRRRPLSAFETWPPWLFYLPVFFAWLGLGVRHRGFTLPAIANAATPLRGFLGESKADALDLLGPRGRAHVARYTVLTVDGHPDHDLARALSAMDAGGLAFPIIAKPDSGQNGAGVKLLHDRAMLRQWLLRFPRKERAILQTYIADEGEAGVFYVRAPGQAHGRIASLTLKYFPAVTGDGMSTLRELILSDPRARHVAQLYFIRHAHRLDSVVPAGQRFRLVSVGNHCRGAIFKNGARHVTPAMEAAFDAIAQEIPGFDFGRFDVRFPALQAFEQGEGFSILELNGADAEMTHIWDADETLAGAYRVLFRQYAIAFELGARNRALGIRPVSAIAFLKAWLDNRSRLKHYAQDE